MRKLRIIVYGMFPRLLPTNELLEGLPHIDSYESLRKQLGEYPDKFRENFMFLVELVAELYRYMDRVRIEVVNFDSVRGLWYAIRYRLGKGLAVIIGGVVFKGEDLSPIRIREYVRSILEAE